MALKYSTWKKKISFKLNLCMTSLDLHLNGLYQNYEMGEKNYDNQIKSEVKILTKHKLI